jgi:hypothetical protein
MNLSSVLTLSFTCLLVCSPSLSAAEKVYKWTDAKGLTHYDQRPPINTQTEVIKTQTGHSDPVDYSNQTTAAAKVDKQADVKKDAPPKDKEQCEGARKNAETLKTYTRIRIKGDDGEYRFLTPDEQKQKLDEANKAVEDNCE